MTTVSEIFTRFAEYPYNSIHDVNHFIKVWSYAKNIGEEEHLDEETQYILEITAILHDIACPILRKKLLSTNGKMQEKYGPDLAREFLSDTDLTEKQLDRICFLIGHHHTPEETDGMDYQILIEADYLVNADESNYSRDNAINMYNSYFKTTTGLDLLKSIYIDR